MEFLSWIIMLIGFIVLVLLIVWAIYIIRFVVHTPKELKRIADALEYDNKMKYNYPRPSFSNNIIDPSTAPARIENPPKKSILNTEVKDIFKNN